MKAYFAHPYELWKTKKEEQILNIIEQRGWEPFNPFDKEDHLLQKHEVTCYYDDPNRELANEIVRIDLKNLSECEVLVAYFPRRFRGVGTIMEIMYAWLKGKYIVIIVEGKSGVRNLHAWLVSAADEYYSSLEDFVNKRNNLCWKIPIEWRIPHGL